MRCQKRYRKPLNSSTLDALFRIKGKTKNLMNDVFYETAPQNVITPNDDLYEKQEIAAFRNQLINTIDSIQPRIDFLEKIINSKEGKSSISEIPLSDLSSFESNFRSFQRTFQQMHERSIETSKKVQNLSLRAQTTTTIATPKHFKPVNDEFLALKDEFNQSLKCIVTLTNNINKKIRQNDLMIKSFKTNNKEGAISNFDKQLMKADELNYKNHKTISELNEYVSEMIFNNEKFMLDKFENELLEAEDLVNELEFVMDNNLTTASEKIKKLQSDKFNLQNSFNSITEQINEEMNNRLKNTQWKINKFLERNDQVCQEINSDLKANFEKLSFDLSTKPAKSIFHQRLEEKQIEELDLLIQRMDDLKRKILDNTSPPPELIDKECQVETDILEIFDFIDEEEDEYLDEEHSKLVLASVDGKLLQVLCYPDTGTYEI